MIAQGSIPASDGGGAPGGASVDFGDVHEGFGGVSNRNVEHALVRKLREGGHDRRLVATAGARRSEPLISLA